MDDGEKEDNADSRYIKEHYPRMDLNWAGGNLGFAKANNIIIRKAIAGGASYVMLLNPDMILEPAAVEKLAAALDRDDKLGSVAPKIYHWDFAKNEKTRILDSCGIREISALRFAEIGRGERDEGQFDRTAILGPTGAAAMY